MYCIISVFLLRSENRLAEYRQFIQMLLLDSFLVIIHRGDHINGVDNEYHAEAFSLDTFQSLWSKTAAEVPELWLIKDLMRGAEMDVKTFNNCFAFFRPTTVNLFEVTQATLQVI